MQSNGMQSVFSTTVYVFYKMWSAYKKKKKTKLQVLYKTAKISGFIRWNWGNGETKHRRSLALPDFLSPQNPLTPGEIFGNASAFPSPFPQNVHVQYGRKDYGTVPYRYLLYKKIIPSYVLVLLEITMF